jgi:hypothetical protein
VQYLFIFLLSLFIQSCGGGGGSSNNDSIPTPTPTPTNQAPTITNSFDNYEVNENQINAFTVTASDSDSSNLTFSISGADSSKFSIGSSSGAVTFISAPDYENPSDADANNDYMLSATVSDGSLTDTKEFTVRVLDDISDNNTMPPDALIYAKVIDGYIEGANVYIDFNWNLQQDEGEPSAEEHGEGGYYFTYGNDEFVAINNVTFDCAQKRIQVSEIPVGAVDQDLGTIDEPFTMYFIPGETFETSETGEALTENLINISPFTGLFLDIVSSVKDEMNVSAIEVADGCGDLADQVAQNVILKVKEFVSELQSKYGINMNDLYEDYIASDNSQRRAKAEKVVNFLQAAEGIRNAIKQEFASDLPDDYEPYVGLSESATDQLFGEDWETINFLEMSIGLYYDGEADAEGWYPSNILHASELKVFEDGMIGNYACTAPAGNTNCSKFDATYENILNQLQEYLSYGAFKNELIIPDIKISSQYRDAKIRNGDDLECQYTAMLIFDAVGTCSEDGCPDRIDIQEQINHNINQELVGLEYPAVCTSYDNPFFYIFSDRKNIWNSSNADGNKQEIFSVQKRYVEARTSNPPVEFLGGDRSNWNYPELYTSLQSIFTTMDTISTMRSGLRSNSIGDEWGVLSRTIFDENDSAKARYEYVVNINASDDLCRINSWDGSGWVIDVETEGSDAFSACYDYINAFVFYD